MVEFAWLIFSGLQGFAMKFQKNCAITSMHEPTTMSQRVWARKSPADALRRFGGATSALDRSHDANVLVWLATLHQIK